jgi:hypothetical protein
MCASGEGVNVDFNSSTLSNILPVALEIVLHLRPASKLFSTQIFQFLPSLALQLIKTVSSLDDRRLLH